MGFSDFNFMTLLLPNKIICCHVCPHADALFTYFLPPGAFGPATKTDAASDNDERYGAVGRNHSPDREDDKHSNFRRRVILCCTYISADTRDLQTKIDARDESTCLLVRQ
jgi:hypothetical protein